MSIAPAPSMLNEPLGGLHLVVLAMGFTLGVAVVFGVMSSMPSAPAPPRCAVAPTPEPAPTEVAPATAPRAAPVDSSAVEAGDGWRLYRSETPGERRLVADWETPSASLIPWYPRRTARLTSWSASS